MKIMNCLILTAAMMAALPHAASARGNAYLGLAMFNPAYKSNDGDHRSTGLMARFGYRLAPHLAVEAHAGGCIGSESGATPEGGASVRMGIGDLVVFPACMHCVWDVLAPVRKHYRFA